MKKITITLALAFIVSVIVAQTTIPVKDTALIKEITSHGDNSTYPYNPNYARYVASKTDVYHFYDYRIFTTIYGKQLKAWAVKYRGKWYSNYPYTVVFSYNRHIAKVYINDLFIYGFACPMSPYWANYDWYNTAYFNSL